MADGQKERKPKRSAAATSGAEEEDDAAAPSSAASPSMAPAGAGAVGAGEDVGESDASDASDAAVASSVTRPKKKQRKAPPSDAELVKITVRRATAWNGALSGFGWIDRDTVVHTDAGLKIRARIAVPRQPGARRQDVGGVCKSNLGRRTTRTKRRICLLGVRHRVRVQSVHWRGLVFSPLEKREELAEPGARSSDDASNRDRRLTAWEPGLERRESSRWSQ